MDNAERYWIYLVVAGFLEICWAVSLKYSDGFSRFTPSVITIVTLVGSFLCLSKAVQGLPVGTAYSVWTGIGAVGSCILGIFLLGEDRSLSRLAFIFLIVVGIIGLKFSDKS